MASTRWIDALTALAKCVTAARGATGVVSAELSALGAKPFVVGHDLHALGADGAIAVGRRDLPHRLRHVAGR